MSDEAKVPLLLVDDRKANLLVLESVLGKDEFDLTFALSGQEALRASLRNDYALVLMDAQMPEMDGFETAELLRANPKTRHLPIIFVTAGLKEASHQFRGYESGAVDYLLKPIEPMIILGKARVFADLYRQRRQIEEQERSLQQLVHQRTAELRGTATQLAASLQEKEVLLKEVYHRVKNNLQVVSSLLTMQARATSEPKARTVLNESADRVRSIALVHEQLYQSPNLARISCRAYIAQLVAHLTDTYQPLSGRVPIRAEIDDLEFGVETAIPLGLIITELISNAYKHAFAGQASGEIHVVLQALEGDGIRLCVADTGHGLPPDFDIDIDGSDSLGMRLVHMLADQLDGVLTVSSSGGARVEFSFVAEPPRPINGAQS